MSDDRRKNLRLDLALSIRYRVIRNQREIQKIIQHKTAGSKNVSTGGLCISINEPVSREDIVKLQLQLPEEEKPVLAFAEVVWVETKGVENIVGVRFLAIKEQDIQRIQTFLDSQRKAGAAETR